MCSWLYLAMVWYTVDGEWKVLACGHAGWVVAEMEWCSSVYKVVTACPI